MRGRSLSQRFLIVAIAVVSVVTLGLGYWLSDFVQNSVTRGVGETAAAGVDSLLAHAIEGIGSTITKISEIATAIASAVEEQGAATQEIARNVQQAAAGTSEVSTNITGVTQAAGQTGAASAQVLSTAGELAKQSEVLRGEVGKFLDNIRAA